MQDNKIINFTAENKLTVCSPQTTGSAGADLRANGDYLLSPDATILVKTGLRIAIPEGFVGLVCTRSGMALKQSCIVLNSPGIIDSDYRGDVGVILHNFGPEDIEIHEGDRIAQLLIVPYIMPQFVQVESLDETERGEGGFGSTGIK